MKRFAASDTDCAANSAALKALAGEIAAQHLSELFATDSQRFQSFSRRLGPLLLDFSKQRINDRVFNELLAQADCVGLKGWIERLFAGEPVNCTEQRAAMHWLLREPGSESPSAELAAVHEQLARMATLVEQVHAGQWRGYAGDAITDVVNIGVGGSELGPLMACRALEDAVVPEARHLNIHYASTMDGSQVSHLLRQLKPHTTLFVISSKSFTTVDTLYNANTARAWLQRAFGDDPAVYRCHFLAVSARPDLMTEWGIPAQNQLQIWDWVGGRFSVWSAVGLAVALKIGMAGFRQLLAGAHQMDTHFRSTPWQDNIPVIMALLGIWNTNYLGISAQAILPYDGRLKYLPAYLTQLEMESNGKSVRRDGSAVAGHTCPVVWGDVGPNAQHAFYQLLHQGTQPVTCDFIVAARRYHDGGQHQATPTLVDQHRLALANCLTQSRLLALGEASIGEHAQLPGYKRYHGNQPSTTLLLDTLTPHALGMLVAAYEHKVFAQAVLWGINPFDQWGVEMGKRIATDMLALLQGEQAETVLDSSTAGLIDSARAGND